MLLRNSAKVHKLALPACLALICSFSGAAPPLRLSRSPGAPGSSHLAEFDTCVRAAAAYEVLSSEEKRRIYDRYGEDGLKQHDAQGGGGGGGAADIFSQ